MRFGSIWAAAFGAGLLLAAQPAGAKAVSREDFSFPHRGAFNVVVFRPDVHVGSLKVGGLDEPNVEWTEAARSNIQASLEAAPEFRDAHITFLDEFDGDQAALLAEYRGMFELVSGAMFTHVVAGGQELPTKQYTLKPKRGKSRDVPSTMTRIDWTLGDGAARLKDITGSDYAMFIFTHDSYGDSGRKTAQAIGMLGCLVGACVIVPAGIHIGYAGLVDLNTGNILWFNTDLAMGGDVREADGAQERVGQLLAGFPSRDAAPEEDD